MRDALRRLRPPKFSAEVGGRIEGIGWWPDVTGLFLLGRRLPGTHHPCSTDGGGAVGRTDL